LKNNIIFFTHDIERPWSLKSSTNGKYALIGYGDDEGQLLQLDLETKEISHYWTEGRHTFSIEFTDDNHAIVGTNNGFIVLLDLVNKVRLKSLKISDSTIKDIQYSKDNKTIFLITIDELFALDISTLEIQHKISLDFNPWDIVLIPNTNLIAIQGNKITLELYEYTNNNFVKLDSKSYGPKKRDMTSMAYNKKHNWLISASEKGFIYIWDISNKKLEQLHEIDLDGDRLYWIQSDDNYITFSSSNKGTGYIDIDANKFMWIPKTKTEGNIKLQVISGTTYLLYTTNNNELGLANLTTNDLNIYDVPHRADYIDLTINGDILGITEEGIVLANFLKEEVVTTYNYDFNSNGSNIFVKNFLFNASDDSILIEQKEGELSILELHDNIIIPIDFYKNNDTNIKDFYGKKILTLDYQKINILDIENKEVKELNLSESFSTTIERCKLLNENEILLINSPDYSKEIDIPAKINILDIDGKLKYSKEIKTTLHFISVYDNKIVEADIINKSSIFDLNTHTTSYFNIGYAFGDSIDKDTLLFDDCKYCIRLSEVEMSCYDLSKLDANNRSKRIWRVEDPILSDYSLLGFSKEDKNFYIVNKQTGELISLDIKNGDILNTYKLQENIIDIKMSENGKYIAWTLKTGEFSYISYPFQSCEV